MATASLAPLVGCSGGQQAGSGQQSSGESKEVENRSEPKPLEITESGWSVVGDGWVYYGFALKNTNKDVEAPSKGESEPFEISCFNMPEHSSFEVYAQVW